MGVECPYLWEGFPQNDLRPLVSGSLFFVIELEYGTIDVRLRVVSDGYAVNLAEGWL